MSCCPLASPDRPAIEAVLFDLDDTLYRIEAIPERVRENIEGESFFFLCSLFFFLADLNFFSLLFLSLSLTHTHTHLLFSSSFLFVVGSSFHDRQAQDRP